MKKQNQKNSTYRVQKELKETHISYYRGFLIKSCLSSFGNLYYTVVNNRINSHIHASTLKIAMKICNIARSVIDSPYLTPPYEGSISLDLYERAYRLAFREQKKGGQNKIENNI